MLAKLKKILDLTALHSLKTDFAWKFGLPIGLFLWSWFGIPLLLGHAFTLRHYTLVPTYFDYSFYTQMLARELFHGQPIFFFLFRLAILPLHTVKYIFTQPEIYLILYAVSGWAAIALIANLLPRLTPRISSKHARLFSLVWYISIHITISLRPGAQSWYVPFGILLVFTLWKWLVGYLSSARSWPWLMASCILATVYPWYFFFACGVILLTAIYKLRYRTLFLLLMTTLILCLIAVTLIPYTSVIDHFLNNQAVIQGMRGGFWLSHSAVLSNTVLLIILWLSLWIRSSIIHFKKSEHPSPDHLTSIFFSFAWFAQLLIWGQALVTGVLLIPEHVRHTVYILTTLSLPTWVAISPQPESKNERLAYNIIATFALAHAAYVLSKHIFGVYSWDLLAFTHIHVFYWTLTGVALLKLSRKYWITSSIFLFVITGVALAGLRTTRTEALSNIHSLTPAAIALQTRIAHHTIICTDPQSGDILGSMVPQRLRPTMSEMFDRVATQDIRKRMQHFAQYYRITQDKKSKTTWKYIHFVLVDGIFPCQFLERWRSVLNTLPLSQSTRDSLFNCPLGKPERFIKEVNVAADNAWSSPLIDRSDICPAFLVTKEKADLWRLPPNLSIEYQDSYVTIYKR